LICLYHYILQLQKGNRLTRSFIHRPHCYCESQPRVKGDGGLDVICRDASPALDVVSSA
jgi:hypothetical protein